MRAEPAEPLYDPETSTAQQRRTAQRAARSLAASVAKLHGAVPLPAAARELLEATETEDYEVAEIVRIIESDPALTGRIIGQVSSSLYGRAKCSSTAQAVTLVGGTMLRAAAVAAAAVELFGRDEAPLAKAVADHAARCGAIARLFAPHCGLASDEMYTCGLLLDIGKLMLLRGADLDYGDLLARDPNADDLHVEERKRYGFDHAVLAGHVLTSWRLPHPLPRVVAWHHQPDRAYRAAGKVPKMVALARIADRLALLGLDPTEAQTSCALFEMPQELKVLGLSPSRLRLLCRELARESVLAKSRDESGLSDDPANDIEPPPASRATVSPPPLPAAAPAAPAAPAALAVGAVGDRIDEAGTPTAESSEIAVEKSPLARAAAASTLLFVGVMLGRGSVGWLADFVDFSVAAVALSSALAAAVFVELGWRRRAGSGVTIALEDQRNSR